MQKEYVCKYCGQNTTHIKAYVCSECHKKLKLVRELLKKANEIKRIANIEKATKR